MSNKITGTGTINIDGTLLESLDDGITINMGGFKREPKAGQGKVAGYQEKVDTPTLELKIHHKKKTSLTFFNGITDSTITVKMDSGPQFVYRQAWSSEPAQLDAGTGELTLKFAAVGCDEVLN